MNPLTQSWVDAVQSDDGAALSALVEKDPTLLQTPVEEVSPVMYCARNGQANALSALLRAGASPSGWDRESRGANAYNTLMAAAMSGHASVCEVLLRDGKMDPNFRAYSTNALLLAARHHHLSVIKLLDKYGADMNAKNGEGSNALLETSRYTSHPNLVDFLVMRGVSCDVEDNGGMTPLMHLANIGDIESIQILTEKGGANLAHVNRLGDSVLRIAERRNMSEVVCYCWKKGLNPTNIAMPCHLGDLHVTRPRIVHQIGGRYQSACVAVGSKLYVYGGHSVDTREVDIPTIKGDILSQDDELTRGTDKDANEMDEVSPNQPDQAPAQPQEPRQGHDQQQQQQPDDDDMEQFQPNEAGDPRENERVGNFFRALNQYMRENAGEDTVETVLNRYVRAILNGQAPGDMEMALELLHAIDDEQLQFVGENDQGAEGEEHLSEEEDEADLSADEEEMQPSTKRQKVAEARTSADRSKLDGDEAMKREDGSEPDEDRYSDAASMSSLDNDTAIRAHSGPNYKTYVLDLDSCKLEYIFPNPQVQPKLANYKLRATKHGPFVGIDPDQLGGFTVKPDADASFPPCLAIATRAFTPEAGPFGYFEVKVVNPGVRRLLTLGLVPGRYPVEGKQPGWLDGSFGLHGDDGAMFYGSGVGDSFADRFEPGDVVGAGVIWSTGEVFFTINGRFLGYSPVKTRTKKLYACVGVRNEDARFRVNFGGSEPFRFDFRAPTVSWSVILPAPSSAHPTLHRPFFAKEPSGANLILFSALGMSSDVFLFNLEKNYYTKRTTTGASPQLRGNESQIVQPMDRSCFAFLSRSKNSPPVLAILDTQELEWSDIGGRFNDFVGGLSAQAPYGAQWQELLVELDNDEFVPSTLCAVNGQLVWIGKSSYVIADPLTGMYSRQPLTTKAVPSRTQGSGVDVKESVFCFGGWDGQAQSNELDVFNVTSGGWYKPAYSGVVPRPRNAHSGVRMETKAAYFGANASDLPSGLQLPTPQTVIVNAFGWSGRNVMSDIDVISIAQDATTRNEGIGQVALDTSLPSDLTLRVRFAPTLSLAPPVLSSTSTAELQYTYTSFPVHKVVLFCRAKAFRDILQQAPTLHYLELGVENFDCFKGFLNFLYTDTIVREPQWIAEHARNLALMVDQWAPDLTPKLLERLLLTRTTLPNLFGTQMLLAFNNELFSDLKLQVDVDLANPVFIPVHKTILISRSPYFRAMCTGGLAETSQSVIRVEDVPVEALRLVIEFLYSYEVPYDRCSEHIVDMFILACRFQISKLKSTLENLLVFNLASENVCSLLLVAHAQTSLTLLTECKRFIANNLAEVETTQDYQDLKESIDSIMHAPAPANQ